MVIVHGASPLKSSAVRRCSGSPEAEGLDTHRRIQTTIIDDLQQGGVRARDVFVVARST